MTIFDHEKNKKSRMSNAFASLKSQPKSHEDQTFKHYNGANLVNQKPK